MQRIRAACFQTINNLCRSPDTDRQLPVAEVRRFQALDGLRVESDEVAPYRGAIGGLTAGVSVGAAVGGFWPHLYRFPPIVKSVLDPGNRFVVQHRVQRLQPAADCRVAVARSVGSDDADIAAIKPVSNPAAVRLTCVAQAFDNFGSGHVVPLLCSLMTAIVYINQVRCQVKCEKISDERRESFEERAAIIEFESGEHISRQASEKLAAEYLQLTEDEIEFLQGAGIARF
jgi:hypothetical protein